MFTGVGTAIITPFDENYNVDYVSLRKIVNFQVESGIDAIIVLGTTGEAPVIDLIEREKIISTVVEEVNGKTKVIVGTGTNDTRNAVELNKTAEKFNVDGLLIVNPYYNKGTQESLLTHYKYISERTNLPIMLYNVPSRTGMNLLPETAVKIHEQCSNITSIKEASGNISQIAHLFSIKPDSFKVYSGNDDQTLPIMAMGGAGVISVFSNAYPAEAKKLSDAIIQGDYKQAQAFSNKYLRMMNLLFVETNPSPIKFVMSELGYCKNILRLPLEPVLEKTKMILQEEMEKYKPNN
ncbi:MAG: 4-hydroxy-tetrahydrodipicolinate synthase [Ignavibacteriales bacterium]|nr:4-hydroxy-tetrahydrodipicolinate synthase [Ignavibacteriales bacterium]